MDLIHIETDELRGAGRECERAYFLLADSLSAVRASAVRLEAAWQGGAAESFQFELGEWLRTTGELIDEADYFSRALAGQADGWEEIDQRWTGRLRELGPAQAAAGEARA